MNNELGFTWPTNLLQTDAQRADFAKMVRAIGDGALLDWTDREGDIRVTATLVAPKPTLGCSSSDKSNHV